MATSYSEIYQAFIFKIEGYKLLSLLNEEREKIISIYMTAVCRKIQKKCIKSRNSYNAWNRTKR